MNKANASSERDIEESKRNPNSDIDDFIENGAGEIYGSTSNGSTSDDNTSNSMGEHNFAPDSQIHKFTKHLKTFCEKCEFSCKISIFKNDTLKMRIFI